MGWDVTRRQACLMILTPLAVWHILFYPIGTGTDIDSALPNHGFLPNEHSEDPLVFSKGQIRGAAMMLVSKPWTRRRGDRQCFFNKSLDDLRTNWFPTNSYPIILQHPNGWSRQEMDDIRDRWPTLEIHFSHLGHSFHNLSPPPPQPLEDEEKPLSSLGYKTMCAFKTYGMLGAPYIRSKQLDYMFYIDDDSCITEPIKYDVFRTMQQNKIAYAYKQIFTDPVNVVRGLPEFVEDYKRQHNMKVVANPSLETWLQQEAVLEKRSPGSMWAFSTNVEWLDLNEFRRKDILEFYLALQKSGMIFHRRWGDAPLRFVLAYLFLNNQQVMRFCSEYVHSDWPTAVSTCADDQQTPDMKDAILNQLKTCVGTCN